MRLRPLVRAALGVTLLLGAVPVAAAQSAAQGEGEPDSERPPTLEGPAVDPELFGGDEPRPDPWRVVGWLGGGVAVRLVEHDDFQQDWLAPAYADLSGALVLPGSGMWRHGIGLGVALNLTRDGTYSAGVDEGTQLVVTPSYVAYLLVGGPVSDVVPFVRAGVPLSVTPDLSPGLELAGGAAYMFLAGLGAYAEVSVAGFLGADSRADSATVHPLLGLELGVQVDWEILP